jgi:hypothetical protein
MAEQRLLFRLLADLVRVAATVGALAALVGIPAFGMEVRSLLVLLVLMVPRATGGVPAPLDFAFGATLLVALWTSMAGWFETTPFGWLVHAVTSGVTAVVLYLILVRVQVLGEPGGPLRRVRMVGWTVLLGVVLGGVWEAFRWFESVTPVAANLAGHLLVDAVGALAAGLVLVALRPTASAVTTARPAARPQDPSEMRAIDVISVPRS